MKELIARLREDYCSCIDGYKSRGMTDPQCSSCDSKDWREECADALERLTAENLRLAGEVSNRNSRALAGDTATKQFDAMYEDIESLTAERDALAKDAERVRVYKQRYFEAIAERDALRADAERYRFIFAESDRVDPVCAVVWKKGNVRNSSEWVDSVGGEWLSKELDAAIAGEKK